MHWFDESGLAPFLSNDERGDRGFDLVEVEASIGLVSAIELTQTLQICLPKVTTWNSKLNGLDVEFKPILNTP